ncbi:DUF4197 domain-containing protein [Ilyomonas limi]|uniref:DUF4197 domain-containing protein n=1 Tax=Ilyomonas limi TaxID=2575867 RepID=A0A4U3KWL3_9BACT|nr:DUF4197 domain-containing protein [Ilyomonas limi]TKK66928.1 DUF4197 domain-containing protein [Ilyomonas limi]
MKKIILAASFAMLMAFSGCETAQQVLSSLPTDANNGGLTTQQIVAGLKEALTVGTQNGTNQLSAVDGFFKNAAVKILMPPEAQKVVSTLQSVGLGSVVDKAVLSMNRAAEDAAKSATPIFVNAIKQMTITDALGILKGGNQAATNYFKNKTTRALTAAFSPIVNKALQQTDATKYWNDVFTVYNQFSTNKVNTNLNAYVTSKAIDGIFYEVGQEEAKIRQDPAARVTDILKKVFGSSLATSGS